MKLPERHKVRDHLDARIQFMKAPDYSFTEVQNKLSHGLTGHMLGMGGLALAGMCALVFLVFMPVLPWNQGTRAQGLLADEIAYFVEGLHRPIVEPPDGQVGTALSVWDWLP